MKIMLIIKLVKTTIKVSVNCFSWKVKSVNYYQLIWSYYHHKFTGNKSNKRSSESPVNQNSLNNSNHVNHESTNHNHNNNSSQLMTTTTTSSSSSSSTTNPPSPPTTTITTASITNQPPPVGIVGGGGGANHTNGANLGNGGLSMVPMNHQLNPSTFNNPLNPFINNSYQASTVTKLLGKTFNYFWLAHTNDWLIIDYCKKKLRDNQIEWVKLNQKGFDG